MCAPQDEKVLKTPTSVKKFLESQNIAYEPGTPDRVLKGKAKARMKMLAEEGISIDAKRRKFIANTTTLSVKALKEMAKKMMDANKEDKAFYRVAFTIEEFSATGADLVQLKHEIGWPVTCTGFVRNGRCIKCSDYVPGIAVYDFKMIIADIDDDTSTMIINGKEGAGPSMFGVHASAFLGTSAEWKKSKMEAVLCAPASAMVTMSFKPNSNHDVQISLYDYLLDNE